MNILVTGGAGYIGSHAARLFAARGHAVTVFDNLSRGHRQAVPGEWLVEGELSDGPLISKTLRDKKIDAVVHFAAFALVGESVVNPAMYYANNFVNTLTLLDAMRDCKVNRLVFSSTCAVYGIPLAVPITEDEKLVPINPYGHAKLAVETALADYAAAYGLGYTALRYFNAAGAHPAADIGEDHDPETHLIPLVLQVSLGQRSHVDILGTDYPTPDGTCIRDYVHVDDLADAHLRALDKIQPGQGNVYNLGTGTGASVREVIRACEAVTGKTIAVKESPRRPGDPPALVASSAKAQRELGWQPQYRDVRSIIETAWKWHVAHPRGYAGQ